MQYIPKFDFAEQLGLFIYMPYNLDPPAFINLFKTHEFISGNKTIAMQVTLLKTLPSAGVFALVTGNLQVTKK